jgi:hypothetical protein
VQLPRALSQDFSAVAAAAPTKQPSHSMLAAAWGEANLGFVARNEALISSSAPGSASLQLVPCAFCDGCGHMLPLPISLTAPDWSCIICQGWSRLWALWQ